MITFLPNLQPSGNEKFPHALNLIPYPEKKHLSGSTILMNLTAPNKEFPNVKSALCVCDRKFISLKI